MRILLRSLAAVVVATVGVSQVSAFEHLCGWCGGRAVVAAGGSHMVTRTVVTSGAIIRSHVGVVGVGAVTVPHTLLIGDAVVPHTVLFSHSVVGGNYRLVEIRNDGSGAGSGGGSPPVPPTNVNLPAAGAELTQAIKDLNATLKETNTHLAAIARRQATAAPAQPQPVQVTTPTPVRVAEEIVKDYVKQNRQDLARKVYEQSVADHKDNAESINRM